MKKVFADASYWIALLDRKDSLHSKAVEIANSLRSAHVFTTDLVLVEVLNGFSKDQQLRYYAAQLVKALFQDPSVTLIKNSKTLFYQALHQYETVKDKQWSLIDCASFEVMRDKKITEALTYDKHFEQAGFIALLRESKSS